MRHELIRVRRTSTTRRLRKYILFAGILLLIACPLSSAFAQDAPLTYPKILTALNATLPKGWTKERLIEKLIADVKQLKVDKPLTADREDDLRQSGATDELIEAIRQNSEYVREPTKKPSPAPIENKTTAQAVMSQADQDKFAEGRVALDKFKDCPAALKALDAVSEGNAEWALYMAKTHECLSNYEEAIHFYKAYDTLAPGHSEIAEKIAELRYQSNPDVERKLITDLVNSVGRIKFSYPAPAPPGNTAETEEAISEFNRCSIRIKHDLELQDPGQPTSSYSSIIIVPLKDLDPNNIKVDFDTEFKKGYTVGFNTRSSMKTIKETKFMSFSGETSHSDNLLDGYFFEFPEQDKANRVAKALVQIVKACQKGN